MEISGAGVGSIASDPLGRLRTAHLLVRVAGARAARSTGGAVLVRRVVAGGAVTIRGVLLDRSGRAIVGAEVQARGYRGRVIGRGLTRRGGRFSSRRGRMRAGSSGSGWRPAADSSRAARTPRSGSRCGRAWSSRRPRDTVFAGGTVLFTGRLSPSPGDLGFGSRKTVVLEWLDPLRRTWRPVVNARLRKDGTFAIPWAFNLRGLTIPVRVTVPQDVGWPLLAATSRTVRVRVT